MEPKLVFSLIATLISIFAFLPYLRDIFLKKTKPHAYTWLIWALTQGTAVVGMLYGGSGVGALSLAVGTFFVIVVFVISLKQGSRNITKGDTILLAIALLAIVVWWQLKSPVLAVVMVSAIDVLGYIPSFRKSYREPWDETVSTWIIFVVGNCFVLLSLREYNFLTMSYVVAISVANLALAVLCLVRRRVVPEPVRGI